ncbi:hypothetical protein ACFY9Q_06320 [Streptomyces sp. NPDC012389]|uniref:hypothetical protein n=1 Tax=Streptomyces sp. NPDC012389 TaxID=3364830 RepID=UPI0036E5FB85
MPIPPRVRARGLPDASVDGVVVPGALGRGAGRGAVGDACAGLVAGAFWMGTGADVEVDAGAAAGAGAGFGPWAVGGACLGEGVAAGEAAGAASAV